MFVYSKLKFLAPDKIFIVSSWTTDKYSHLVHNHYMMTELEKLKLFGRNIAKYRKTAVLSQNKLAESVDVSREHLAKAETAKRGVSLELLFKISEVLNVPEKEFFEFNVIE